MLKQRVLTALILFPIVVALILLPPTIWFAALVGVVFTGAAWEWALLAGFRTSVGRAAVVGGVAAIILAILLVWTPGLLTALTFAGVAWWIGCCFWLRHFTFAAAPNAENRMVKLGAGVLVIVPAFAAAMQLHASERGNW